MTLKIKIFKYMTLISKNVYIDNLDDIVNKYDNTYHSTMKMKSANVKSNTYIDSSKEINDKNPKFKIGDNVRISRYKNVFAKGYTPNWSEKFFATKKVKNTVSWTNIIMILMEKKMLELFRRTNCKKQTKKNLELKK